MNTINLTINKKQVTCQMGVLAFRKYCDFQGINLDLLGETLEKEGVFGISDMVYFGHEAYCDLNGLQVSITRGEATMLLEEINEKTTSLIQEAILDTKMMGVSLRDMTEGGTKKKKQKPKP